MQYPDSAVAIIGAACRFAGADSLEQLWTVLAAGASQCIDIPKHRFKGRPCDEKFQGNVMRDIDAFDHKFFGVSSREASFRDPQQRLALEVTYQALESAGYFAVEKTEQQQDIGCFIASTMNEYHENVITHASSAFSLTGSLRPFIAGQVSHYFGFTGPAITLDAACAASGAAINIACRAVASGECRSAVVGAANLFISPHTFQDLAVGHFTSTTGPSKPFDAAADGYGRGEGVAVVFLKRLSDALLDGDVVKGVISATATNQCANVCPITVPHAPSQSSLFRKVLRMSRLNVDQIGYIEAHGTGTRVGDPIEAESIRSVFGDPNRDPTARIYMGSLKSNIGHTESSAGLSGLIKMMLMIEKGIIPQQALFNHLHPGIAPLEPDGLEIPTKNIQWTARHRAGCVNNYGASGCNTAMILTQPPVPAKGALASSPSTFPISIMAFSRSSLRSYCSALLDFINDSDGGENLALDLSFHLSRRRNPKLPFAMSASISSLRELRNLLITDRSEAVHQSEYKKMPTVLFFGGQDGNCVSVSRALYDSCLIFRTHLHECEKILQTLGSYDLFPALFEPDTSGNSVHAHTRLFSVQYASAKAWIDCGIQPSRLIGHSFGQITALCVSGVLSLHSALRLVISRALLIDERWGSENGSMIAIEATQDEVYDLIEQNPDLNLEVACYNGARSFVLAGTTSAVGSLEARMQGSSDPHRFKRLRVSNAFHSALAEPLVAAIQDVVAGMDMQPPEIPLETCSTLNTWSSIDPATIASYIRLPVYFHQAVQRIAERLGPCVWIEAGSGRNASLLRRALEPQNLGHEIKSVRIDSSTAVGDLAATTADLWGLHFRVQFWPFHHVQRHQYQPLNLPPYQFDQTRHWLDWQESSARAVAEAPLTSHPKPFIRLAQETKGGYLFEVNTQCDSWRAKSADNYVVGISTCPISLPLDLFSEAISKVRLPLTQDPYICRVQRMSMPLPIVAETNDTLHVHMGKLENSQTCTLRLSWASNADYDIFTGVIWIGKPGLQTDLIRFERLMDIARINALAVDTEADSIRGRGVYKVFADLFMIPKAKQIIREVSAKANEATASVLSLPETPSRVIEFLLHIPLICLNSVHERPNDHVLVNTTVGDAQIRSACPSSTDLKSPHIVYLKFFGLDELEPTCDVYAFDAQNGRISAALLDVGFTRVSVEALRHAIDGNATALPQRAIRSETKPLELPTAHEGHGQIGQESDPFFQDGKPMHPSSLPEMSQVLPELLVRVADVNPDKVHPATSIADLGIDSLMWMEIAYEINKFFATNIDLTDFFGAETMRDLCQLVADRSTGFSYNPSISSESSPSLAAGSHTTAVSSVTEISEVGEKCEPALDMLAERNLEPSILSAALEAFDSIRSDFDVLAKETGCDTFWTDVHIAQSRLIEAQITEAFAQLGCDIVSVKAGEKLPVIPHKPGRNKLLECLMLILRDGGLITQVDNRWLRTDKTPPAQSSSTLFDHMRIRFPKWAPEHELIQIAGSNLASHLDGTQDPLRVLFGTPERRKLMADQYRSAPIQSAVSRQLARFIERCFSSQMPKKPIQVLEVGGGTCGTTAYAIEAFVRAGIPVEYTFTDISQSFIAAAKSTLKDYAFVKYRTLDISVTPSVELRGQYDMIVATNVVHATRDAQKSAGNVRQMLRAGGIFTMVEYTRRYAAMDIVFGQLDGWWLFDDGRTHAIMNETEWDAKLKAAGYSRVDWTGTDSPESEIARIFLAS